MTEFTSTQLLFKNQKNQKYFKKLKIVDKVEDSYEATVKDADIIIGVPVRPF